MNVRHLPLLLSLLCVSGNAVYAQSVDELLRAGAISIRAHSDPETTAWYSQQTRYHVEIRTNTWFTDAPRFPELQLDGAISILPGGFATNYTEREGGITYTVQRRTYLIYPQRTGALQIPPVAVRFGISIDGQPSELLTLATEPAGIDVRMPEAAAGLSQLTTTRQFRVRDELSRDLGGLRVGDTFTRTITMTGADTLALMLPEIRFAVPAGISVYPARPVLSDNSNRGQFSGERIESATFVMEQAGDYELPGMELHWWSPDASRLNTETLEHLSFSVTASSALATTLPDTPVDLASSPTIDVFAALQRFAIPATVFAGVAYLAMTLLRRYLPRLVLAHRQRRESHRKSEAYNFNLLLRSLSDEDFASSRRLFWGWLDTLPGIYSVADLSEAAQMPELLDLWRDAAISRFSAGAEREAQTVRLSTGVLKTVRSRVLQGTAATIRTLPVDCLNPRGTVSGHG